MMVFRSRSEPKDIKTNDSDSRNPYTVGDGDGDGDGDGGVITAGHRFRPVLRDTSLSSLVTVADGITE